MGENQYTHQEILSHIKGFEKSAIVEFIKSNIYIKEYFCKNCEYLWKSNKKLGCPSICPNCKSKKFILRKEVELNIVKKFYENILNLEKIDFETVSKEINKLINEENIETQIIMAGDLMGFINELK
jgi:predicted Zn-ribbon and HTH transcriptional regulator